MVYSRQLQGLVEITKELYIIGGFKKEYEVFDSTAKRFVLIITATNAQQDYGATVFSIENKIIVVGSGRNSKIFYDVEKNTWTEIDFNSFCQKKF